MPSMRPLLLGTTTAALLALTGCGQDVTAEDVAVAAIGTDLGSRLASDQAQCTAADLVSRLGVDGLEEAGVLDDNGLSHLTGTFDQKTASAIADATVKCWDWRKSTETLAARYPAADPADWNSYLTCVEKLDDELRASVEEAKLKGAGTKDQQTFAIAEQKCRRPLGDPVAAN